MTGTNAHPLRVMERDKSCLCAHIHRERKGGGGDWRGSGNGRGVTQGAALDSHRLLALPLSRELSRNGKSVLFFFILIRLIC